MWTGNDKGLLAIMGILTVVPSAIGMVGSKIIYVDINAAGCNDGSSWTNAYNYLQDALVHADQLGQSVEIRLAQGIYKPDRGRYVNVGDRLASFNLVNGVVVKGGYAGNRHADPNIRDVNLYETILSGDLEGNDRPLSFLDYSASDPITDVSGYHLLQDNSQNVLKCVGTNATVVLDGLTICGGYLGPAVKVTSGSVRVINCLFRDNGGDDGAGLYCEQSCVVVLGCTFSDNLSSVSTLQIKDSELILLNCTFNGNPSIEQGTSGGIVLSCDDSLVIMFDSVFVGNRAFDTGRAIVSAHNTHILASNCIFTGNLTISGACILNDDSVLSLNNCTFHQNRGKLIISRSCDFRSVAQISGCIFREQMPWFIENHPGSVVDIRYCNIAGGESAVFNLNPNGGLIWGQGNIDVDPCFAAPGYWQDPRNTPDYPLDDIWIDGDYHLKSQAGRWDPVSKSWVQDDITSPCIDAGDPGIPVIEEPSPNGGRINMGAYGGTAEASKSYFGEPVCQTIVAGDINGDCIVDAKDLSILASHWLGQY